MTSYKDLLSATQEAEMEWTESKISVRVKSANVKECREEGITELKNKIAPLTANLKSSILAIRKPEGKKKRTGKTIQKGGQWKSKLASNTPTKGKGLGLQQQVHLKEIKNPFNVTTVEILDMDGKSVHLRETSIGGI